MIELKKTITAFVIVAIVLLTFFVGIGILLVTHTTLPPFPFFRGNRWSIGIYTASLEQFPYFKDIEGITNPVLTADNVTDAKAEFVADPFLVQKDNKWYMFFEVKTSNDTDIGLASSPDGLHWTYDQIILDTPWATSFPYTFKWKGEYYMTPCVPYAITLYKAKNFPQDWVQVENILTGRPFVDPLIFQHDNLWWLIAGKGGSNDTLWLYYSDNLIDPTSWIEHKASPIVKGNANIARPAGIAFLDNKIIRFAQDDDPYYGNKVWAFVITRLTKTSYREHRFSENPILKGDGDGWNADGMHTIGPLQVEDKWIASVDGFQTSWVRRIIKDFLKFFGVE